MKGSPGHDIAISRAGRGTRRTQRPESNIVREPEKLLSIFTHLSPPDLEFPEKLASRTRPFRRDAHHNHLTILPLLSAQQMHLQIVRDAEEDPRHIAYAPDPVVHSRSATPHLTSNSIG